MADVPVSESARLLRRARAEAGISQVELALRAAVTQSVVSAYENGHREPSLATLRRLVEATGLDLVIDVVEPPSRRLPDTERGRLLRRERVRIREIAARYGATNLRVFGSVARGEDGPDSDIDIAADLSEDITLIGLTGLARKLTDLLEVDVDVVPARSLRPRVAADLRTDGILL